MVGAAAGGGHGEAGGGGPGGLLPRGPEVALGHRVRSLQLTGHCQLGTVRTIFQRRVVSSAEQVAEYISMIDFHPAESTAEHGSVLCRAEAGAHGKIEITQVFNNDGTCSLQSFLYLSITGTVTVTTNTSLKLSGIIV